MSNKKIKSKAQSNTTSETTPNTTPNTTSNTTPNTTTNYTFIDLFCGIGGFHQALKKLNGTCVFASDIDEHCRTTYEQNYGIKPEGDITKIDIPSIPPFDILCGGFPCQPFSKAGYQKGFEDDRGNLFFVICAIIKHHNPKYVLLENVRNLSTHDKGNTWKVIKEHIDQLGYYTYDMPTILNVLHFNVPQNRERVIIMCKRKDLGQLPTLPIVPKNPKKTLTCHIKDYIKSEEHEINKKYKITGKLKVVETIWDEFIQLIKTHNIGMPKFPLWTDWWDNELSSNPAFYKKYKNWIDKNREFYNNPNHHAILKQWLEKSRAHPDWKGAVRKMEWQAGTLKPQDSIKTLLWSSRGSGIRIKQPDYIPTLVAINMNPVYGPESRKLSPKELLRLQSFPDTLIYDTKKIYKQLGNSVNTIMIERCARFLILNEPLFV
jgi:DNA (cytosine-5)-methyltransferase 1